MSLHVKQNAIWRQAGKIWTRQNGIWRPVRRAFVRHGGAWRQFFQDEVVVTLGNRNDVVLKSLFTATEWSNPLLRKRVVIPVGVIIGAAYLAYAIATTITSDGQAGSFAGDLILDVYGSVRGIGGAPNAGTGGNCIWGNHYGQAGQKLVVNLHPGGSLLPGGGGGGFGGQGGPGVWYSGRTVQEGPIYDGNYAWNYSTNNNSGDYSWAAFWAGSVVGTGFNNPATSFSTGGVTYYRGSLISQGGSDDNTGWSYHQIYRQYTAYDVPNYTSGGPGGSGGRGQGSDGAAASGSPGSGGGVNAGSGASGASGGGFGQSGGSGGTGNSGNNGGGSGGQTGGLPGAYLAESARIAFNNLGGTVVGRLT